MTLDQYYEMCEQLGTEPDENDLPVDIGEMPDEVQTILVLYSNLVDIWEPMGGTYLGKNLGTVEILFRVFKIEPELQYLALDLVSHIDGIRKEIYRNKKPAK